MNKILLIAALLVPSFAIAAPMSAATARRDIRAKLGPGMLGSGWNVDLGAKKGATQAFFANQKPAKNWKGGLGPVLIPAVGKINLNTGKISFNHVE